MTSTDTILALIAGRRERRIVLLALRDVAEARLEYPRSVDLSAHQPDVPGIAVARIVGIDTGTTHQIDAQTSVIENRVAADGVGVFVAAQTDRCRRAPIGGPEHLDLRAGGEAVAHAGLDLVAALNQRLGAAGEQRQRTEAQPALQKQPPLDALDLGLGLLLLGAGRGDGCGACAGCAG